MTYTPWNFLYFCNVALLLTLVAVWTENALLVSMDDKHPPTVLAPGLWLLLMLVVNVVVLYVPTHLILRKICAPAVSER